MWLALVCGSGLLAGLLLLRTVPKIAGLPRTDKNWPGISVIVPARNEESNLPALLGPLQHALHPPLEVLVIDDGSTDNTARVAAEFGASVLASGELPAGWTGKTWACYQGAQAARGDLLFFLDADTYFVPQGYERIVSHFLALPVNAVLSVLPFHRTRDWYEELSLFFNVLMAMGAGGFARLDAPHLFGQSLLLPKGLYFRAGGHQAVRQHVLENLCFAAPLRRAGARIHTAGGRGTLEIRMFAEGIPQLVESWRKGFAEGSRTTSPLVLLLSIHWLGAAVLTALLLISVRGPAFALTLAIYLLYAAQIAFYARQLGTFRWITAALYPVPLAFYFVVFGQSVWLRVMRRPAMWRGRPV